MTLEWWVSFLAWAAGINYGILLLVVLAYLTAHDAMFRLHRRWFELTRPQFDLSLYALFGLYKLAIWFFLLVPLIVLCVLR